jgi:hypothetical protein
MPRFVPAAFPHDLRRRPQRQGEKAVWDALANALDDSWTIFYDRRAPGSRRAIDFLVIHPGRGLAAIEVKGGLVHAGRGRFRQIIRRNGLRKTVDPFGQLKRALAALAPGTGLDLDPCPRHLAVALPLMAASAFTFEASQQILTREALAPGPLRSTLEAALPPHGDNGKCRCLNELITQMTPAAAATALKHVHQAQTSGRAVFAAVATMIAIRRA